MIDVDATDLEEPGRAVGMADDRKKLDERTRAFGSRIEADLVAGIPSQEGRRVVGPERRDAQRPDFSLRQGFAGVGIDTSMKCMSVQI